MTNKLFTEKEAWTKEAFSLMKEFKDFVGPFMNCYITRGFSIREIAHIMILSILDLEAQKCIRKRLGGSDEEFS